MKFSAVGGVSLCGGDDRGSVDRRQPIGELCALEEPVGVQCVVRKVALLGQLYTWSDNKCEPSSTTQRLKNY